MVALETTPRAPTAADADTPADDGFYRFAFTAMGSPCEIVLQADSYRAADGFREWALDWIEGFEAVASVFRPDSTVSRINREAGREWVTIPPDIRELVALSNWFHWTTEGIFDPSSAPLLRIWDYHKPTFQAPSSEQIRQALAHTGWKNVKQRGDAILLPQKGMAIDFGGIGKEYAVDKVMKGALDAGFSNVLVNFGHDIRVHGSPPQKGPWLVGLEDPEHTGRCWSGVALTNHAVCTSGAYLRYAQQAGNRYGHILDPRTGKPADTDCLSVHVVAPSCTEAGILSTASFILGSERGHALLEGLFGIEGCLYTATGPIMTRGFENHCANQSYAERNVL